MKLEHFALNVEDPVAMADWYARHLGLRVARRQEESPYTTFLADDSGQILLELYGNPAAAVPPYRQMDPLLVHIAFVSADPQTDSRRLVAAGASLVTTLQTPDGSHLVMLRDPWGLALQLCRRGQPLLSAPH